MPSLSGIIKQASRGADLYFVFRFLRLLTMKWEKTAAYKYGIIDKKGIALKKSSELETVDEKAAYTMLHRLVFKMRRLIEKVPIIGKSILLNYAAALFLLKEQNDKRIWTDENYMGRKLMEFLENGDWEADAELLREEIKNQYGFDKSMGFLTEGKKDLPPHLQKLIKDLEKKQKELEKKGLKVKTFVYNPDTGKPDIELKERTMTDAEKKKREEIVLSLKKKKKDFQDRYGDEWEDVMYATATKMAMGEEVDEAFYDKISLAQINAYLKGMSRLISKKDLINNLKKKFNLKKIEFNPQFTKILAIEEREMENFTEFYIDEAKKVKRYEVHASDPRTFNRIKNVKVKTLKQAEKVYADFKKKGWYSAIAQLRWDGIYTTIENDSGMRVSVDGPLSGWWVRWIEGGPGGEEDLEDFPNEKAARKFAAQIEKKGGTPFLVKNGKPVKEEVEEAEKIKNFAEFQEDSKMGKQSNDQLKKLHKTASAKDQSSPANKSFTDRIEKEMKKRGILVEVDEAVEIDEEVFYWYIIQGNTQKGKVAYVGTERQMKLKIRKPTFPSNHVLMKSRKRLTLGDKWKGSHMPEEVEVDELIKEGTALQVKMALSDVGITKVKWKNETVYVMKKDVEKAKKALEGNVKYKGKTPKVSGGLGGGRYVESAGIEEADAPVNSAPTAADSGNIQYQEPVLGKKKKKKIDEAVQVGTFAGKQVFVVDSDMFHQCRLGKRKYHRYEKYVGIKRIGKAIREYGLKFPKRPIILQNGEGGPMLYLRYGKG